MYEHGSARERHGSRLIGSVRGRTLVVLAAGAAAISATGALETLPAPAAVNGGGRAQSYMESQAGSLTVGTTKRATKAKPVKQHGTERRHTAKARASATHAASA
jgi:predicted ABC-type transport system involved in lysophospholipase L1 biosynthesis ATPase subunit